MRWFWVDRFTEFVSGSHAKAIKTVALDEECVDEYLPTYPVLPPTLIIEGMAQLGGILLAEHFEFRKRLVLAKVGKATFHAPARVGDQLFYEAKLDGIQDNGGTIEGVSTCGGEVQAEISLMFACLEGSDIVDGPLYAAEDLHAWLLSLDFYSVAVGANGQRFPRYAAFQTADSVPAPT
ncbi:MAG: beta-hydroxyacyl-ACP dehydratase [Rhodopirellula sp. TMED11]|nr:MAG: beta-hydroxyacyl-ACP dehydratase [Rhodopirellula sp. TMED11]